MARVRNVSDGHEWDMPDAVASGLVASGDVEYVKGEKPAKQDDEKPKPKAKGKK